MKLQLVVSPEAWSDVDDIAAFIGKDSPGSAERFFEAAWASFEMLTEYPRVGMSWTTWSIIVDNATTL